jgi:hypothetical protein
MSNDVELEVVLKAKGIEVAASKDAAIWLTTMGLITGTTSLPSQPGATDGPMPDPAQESASNDLVGKFAKELGIQREQLEGAAGPSLEPPFLHLDHKYWETLRSSAGTKATAPVALAATLLLLWDRHAKIGDVTIATCTQVLKTIDLPNTNPTRGVKNCPWIQPRGSSLKLNPALISQAEELARKYCTRAGSVGR